VYSALRMNWKDLYAKHYKILTIIPIVILLISLGVLYNNYRVTGEIVAQDVTLKGGITATVTTTQPVPNVEEELKSMLNADISVRTLREFGSNKQIGFIIETPDVAEADLRAALENTLSLKLTDENFSIEQVGESLGKAFYNQMLVAIALAFIFIGIVVIITFRAIIPSVTVIFAAFMDMVTTLAIMTLLGIKLSTSGIAAILTLIVYSIDTDMLITTKALKRVDEGTIVDRLAAGFKTGMTMTVTTIVALTAGYFISTSIVIKQIFLIIIIGFIVDVIATYLMNAGILLWWVKRKNG
ncbi:hypothetical protein HY501_02135, partial [Candidatus Woesearchaeota archaeon]|nr:hypothetical protein [Candidatus Woesearchaeota archaeon]